MRDGFSETGRVVSFHVAASPRVPPKNREKIRKNSSPLPTENTQSTGHTKMSRYCLWIFVLNSTIKPSADGMPHSNVMRWFALLFGSENYCLPFISMRCVFSNMNFFLLIVHKLLAQHERPKRVAGWARIYHFDEEEGGRYKLQLLFNRFYKIGAHTTREMMAEGSEQPEREKKRQAKARKF